ncbi:leucine-rich melanocyte differentiation-associated protein isoform X7 [Oryctolagus cuniculus]|uniref:leucine-rich melanocyte differentiation-associated protein isoform X7 n=1 Tax=Oryctolagus cuniculus TaxID=9986 RepID=UPI00387A22F3
MKKAEYDNFGCLFWDPGSWDSAWKDRSLLALHRESSLRYKWSQVLTGQVDTVLQKSTAPGARTKPILGEEPFAAGLCWDLLFLSPLKLSRLQTGLPVRTSLPLLSTTTHLCLLPPGSSPATEVSWASVATFTTGRTRRATGLSETTSSEATLCTPSPASCQKKGKPQRSPKLKKPTPAPTPPLREGCDFRSWYLVLTLPGLSRASFCLRLSGHREIDMIALKQVSSTRVTDSSRDAPGLTA